MATDREVEKNDIERPQNTTESTESTESHLQGTSRSPEAARAAAWNRFAEDDFELNRKDDRHW
jgi:hypothetical protein